MYSCGLRVFGWCILIHILVKTSFLCVTQGVSLHRSSFQTCCFLRWNVKIIIIFPACQLRSLGWGEAEYNICDTHTRHLSKWAPPRTPGLLFSKPPLLNSDHKMRLPPRFLSQFAVLWYQSSLLKSECSGSGVQGVYFQTGVMIGVILRELWLGMCLHKGARCQKKAKQTAAGPRGEPVWNGTGWKKFPAHSTRSILQVLDTPGCWSTCQPYLCSSSLKNTCSRPLHTGDSSLCFSEGALAVSSALLTVHSHWRSINGNKTS